MIFFLDNYYTIKMLANINKCSSNLILGFFLLNNVNYHINLIIDFKNS
jgi:hypothetical protein